MTNTIAHTTNIHTKLLYIKVNIHHVKIKANQAFTLQYYGNIPYTELSHIQRWIPRLTLYSTDWREHWYIQNIGLVFCIFQISRELLSLIFPFTAVGEVSPFLSTNPLMGIQLASPGKNAEPFKYDKTCGVPGAMHVVLLGYTIKQTHKNIRQMALRTQTIYVTTYSSHFLLCIFYSDSTSSFWTVHYMAEKKKIVL